MTENQSHLTIDNEGLPAMEVGEEYAEWLQASGGTAPYSFEKTDGDLPPGIEVTSMGTVNGVPSQAGDFIFFVKVTDSAGASMTQAFDVQVLPQPDPNSDN
jgi:hypothetical protein